MKRLLPLMVCAFIAFASAFGEEPNPPVPAGGTILLCPAAFGPEEGGCGVIDRDNRVIVKPDYYEIVVHGNIAVAGTFGRLGIVALDGRVLTPFAFDSLQIEDTAYTWKATRYYGPIQVRKLDVSIPLVVASTWQPGLSEWEGAALRLDGAPLLSDDFKFQQLIGSRFVVAAKKADGKLRVFDVQGTDVGGRDFSYVWRVTNTPFIIMGAGGRLLIYDDSFKRVSSEDFVSAGEFSEGLLAVKTGTRWGFMDKEGQLTLPAKYERVSKFSEGLCAVTARLLPNGEVDMEERPAPGPGEEAREDALWGYIDTSGRFVLRPQFTHVSEFREGIATVSQTPTGSTTTTYCFIDKTGWKLAPSDDWMHPPYRFCDEVIWTYDGRLLWGKNRKLIAKSPMSVSYDPASGLVLFSTGTGPHFVVTSTGFVSTSYYRQITPWSKGLLLVKQDDETDIFDDAEKQTVVTKIIDYSEKQVGDNYAEVGELREGLALFRKPDGAKFGYLDESGTVSIEPAFFAGRSFSNGRAAAYSNGWGYIDKTGHWVIEPKYEDADIYLAGLSSVKLGGKWGVIDSDGKQVVPFEYAGPVRFAGKYAPFKVRTMWGYVDPEGHPVIEPKYESVYQFRDGIAVVRTDGKYGAIDALGAFVIQPMYTFLEPVGDGVLAYSVSPYVKRFGLLGTTGTKICDPLFDGVGELSEGRLGVKVTGQDAALWGFVDSEGKWIVAPRFSEVQAFREGLAAVQVTDMAGSRWGYIDREGRMVIPPRFFLAESFSEGMAVIGEERRYGYVDLRGNCVIAIRYKSAKAFRRGSAMVKADIGQILVNPKGEVITSPDTSVSEPVANGYIARKKTGNLDRTRIFGVIDFEGKWLIEPAFDDLYAGSGEYPLIGFKKGKFCYVDEKGNALFVDVGAPWPFHGGYASCLAFGVGYRVIDRTGRVAFTWPFEMRNFQEVPLPRRAAGEAK